MHLAFKDNLQMNIKVILGIFSTIFILLIAPVVGFAQGFIVDWSNPEVLFSTPDGLKSNELWVLRDQADSLYVWWPLFVDEAQEELDSSSLIRTLHTQRIDEDWRSPIDVMVWPDAGRLTTVVIDDVGILHGFSATDCISYVNAPHDEAMSARGWGDRMCLDKTGLVNPSVVRGQDGTIYVVYASLGNHSLRLIYSKDNGATWSSYMTVEEEPENFLLSPILAIDEEGRLHMVWSIGQAPDAYPPLGVYYSRSDDAGKSWTTPIQLGGIDESQPAIAVYKQEVHVLWNGDAAKRGRYYRYSPDAGESWGAVEVLSPPSDQGGRGGLQRPPAIIVDNLGNVHVLLHEQESLYYASKTDLGWRPKQPLYNPDLMNAVELFAVRLAISGGNSLHAIYILKSYDQSKDEDPRNHIWRIFHQSREINAVNELPTLWPTHEQEVSERARDTPYSEVLPATSAAVPTQVISFDNDLSNLDTYNPAWSIYVSIISVSVFILILLGIFVIRQRS